MARHQSGSNVGVVFRERLMRRMLTHSPHSIRIIIADACPIMRVGLITTIERVPHLHVEASVAHHNDLFAHLQTNSVDVVVMHLVDIGDVPVSFLRELKHTHPQLGIVIVTANVDHLVALLAAGANACVVYEEPDERLHLAILAAAQGEAMVHLGVAMRLTMELNGSEPIHSRGCAADTQLSQRESEILRLVARGATNRAIADRLTITVPTVKRHLSNILRKLDAIDRAEAVTHARARGFL
jgi:DNA-binding NarL/FixJ family response regulator